MRLYFILLVSLLLVACSPQQGMIGSTSTPPVPTLQGSVDIAHPISGSIIYADVLIVEGSAQNLPDAGFRLVVFTPSDAILTEALIQPDGENWQIEMVHNHSGDPIEATLVALAADPAVTQDYDIASVAIAPSEQRPDGTFGEILVPSSDAVLGGDFIQVVGRGSGFFENTFSLYLEQPDGTLISETIVTMVNPYFVDDRIFEADVATNGYLGDAVLRMVYTDARDGTLIEVGRVEFAIGTTAG